MFKLKFNFLVINIVLLGSFFGTSLPVASQSVTDAQVEALKLLSDRYGCLGPNSSVPNLSTALSRQDFLSALTLCIETINYRGGTINLTTEDSRIFTLLVNEFVAELSNGTPQSLPAETEFVLAPESPRLSNPGDITLTSDSTLETAVDIRQGISNSGNLSVTTSGSIAPSTTSAGGNRGNVNFSLPDSSAPPTSLGTGVRSGFDNFDDQEEFNREDYNPITDNPFLQVGNNPLSTFSIDVDTASYTNVRRFINDGQRPPKDAVRIEELINYFTYDYPQPEGDRPFSVTTELSQAPWNRKHQLVHIGLQGKEIATENLPPSNLVFLLDVSGSMNSPRKLPLLKAAFRLLVNELDAEDRVSIVVYAGAAGMVLPPTPGNQKDVILDAIDGLQAQGSTAGAAGIQLAYRLAQEQLIEGGNNRVILATDGDFNVGVSSEAELVRLIEEKRENDIFLTVLGFGSGNLQDAKMEQLADRGNGNYAYIDSILEAKKVLVSEMGATLLTIAKDVKIQVEFNPAKVQAYRLIGYENRLLRDEDFNDDTKDAGEMGAGHSVTALYEIIPVGVETEVELPEVDDLRYQQTAVEASAYDSDEVMLVKLRYKEPTGDTSQLITQPVVDREIPLAETSSNFKFSAAIAEFGMVLRDSEYQGNATLEQVLDLAQQSQGDDLEGYRGEFIRLVRSSELLNLTSRD